MDAITQIQSYLRTLAAALCSSIENLQQESEPVVDPEASLSVEQRNKVEERAEHLFRLFYEGKKKVSGFSSSNALSKKMCGV